MHYDASARENLYPVFQTSYDTYRYALAKSTDGESILVVHCTIKVAKSKPPINLYAGVRG